MCVCGQSGAAEKLVSVLLGRVGSAGGRALVVPVLRGAGSAVERRQCPCSVCVRRLSPTLAWPPQPPTMTQPRSGLVSDIQTRICNDSFSNHYVLVGKELGR